MYLTTSRRSAEGVPDLQLKLVAMIPSSARGKAATVRAQHPQGGYNTNAHSSNEYKHASWQQRAASAAQRSTWSSSSNWWRCSILSAALRQQGNSRSTQQAEPQRPWYQ
jgi:hypothetical protein